MKTIEEIFEERWTYKNVEQAVAHTNKELEKAHKELEKARKEEERRRNEAR